MKIFRCVASSSEAQLAFKLRYAVFGAEMKVPDPNIDHVNRTYIDELDAYSRIYLAIKDGQAIATARALYDRDFDFKNSLPRSLSDLLNIDRFVECQSGTLAISTKFAISPSQRGSLAAHLVTAKMFGDFLDDGIHFLFSMCEPGLLDFYSQLGFRSYSRSIHTSGALLTPIVLVTHDFDHLKKIRSPLFKQIQKRDLHERDHRSVRWFLAAYAQNLDSFVANYDETLLEKILSFPGVGNPSSDRHEFGIFDGMSSGDIQKIIGSGKFLQFMAGDAIVQEGLYTDEMFIVIEGGVDIRFRNDNLPKIGLGPGQFFGEISMLSGTARTADCVATTKTQLAFVSRQNLERLMKVEPEVCSRLLYNLARALSSRLARTNEYMKMLAVQ